MPARPVATPGKGRAGSLIMMKLVLGKRRSGRTTELLAAAIAANGIVIVHGERELNRIRNLIGPGVLRNNIITFQDFINGEKLAGRANPLYIDNCAMFLQLIAGPRKIDRVVW